MNSFNKRVCEMLNRVLRDDPPTFVVWQSGRHVERTNAAKTVESEAPPPGESLITDASAAAGLAVTIRRGAASIRATARAITTTIPGNRERI